MSRLSLVLFALLPLALLIAGGGGFSLAGRALRPVDEITRAAAAISDRDLSQRLPVRTQDELGRLASTFNALIDRLAVALDRQQRFTADASHELRTPLAIIRSVTTQKLMRARTPAEYEQALQQIDDASSYMSRLVTHLLTLARADAGEMQLDRERIDLTELLRHAAAQVAESSGCPIRVVGDSPVSVFGDTVQLTALFLNLLENAARHTSPKGEVTVFSDQDGAAATVVVQDNGVGIAEEHIPHIFERFYRVDRSRARASGGAGLGLAIGQWIAQSHGGSIRAESVLGSWTRMTVTLPLAIEKVL